MFPDESMRRSYILGVLNGALFNFGSVFIDPNTVLALFIAATTGSDALVGLVAAVAALGRIISQVISASKGVGSERKIRLYHLSFAVRGPALVGMVAVVLLANGSLYVMASLVVLAYALYAFGQGFATVPFMDIISNILRPSMRSSFFAWRNFLGLGMAILSGYTVKLVLGSPERFPFPDNFILLFSLGATFCIAAMFSFSVVREPLIEQKRVTVSVRETIGMAHRILLQDVVYRRYLTVRCLIVLGSIAGPFYILYATRTLGLNLGSAGLLIVVMKLGGMSSYLFWGRAADVKGTRVMLLAGTLLLVMVPLSALTSSFWTPLLAAVVTFAIMGLANAGVHIGLTNYLLDHCEPSDRPVYVALTQVIISFAATVPLVGGIIAGMFGYGTLFVISLVVTVLGATLAFTLPEPRHLAEKRFRSMVRLA